MHDRRARRLLRFYPREWRSRYGEEFHELLIAEMEERPHSVRRMLDVIRSGALARMATTGLIGLPVDPAGLPRRAMRTLGVASCAFFVIALAVWSQLTIGWQWSQPAASPTVWAMVVMSLAVLAFGLACLAAALPVLWTACRGLVVPGGKGWSALRPWSRVHSACSSSEAGISPTDGLVPGGTPGPTRA